jgi:hypothetical protein
VDASDWIAVSSAGVAVIAVVTAFITSRSSIAAQKSTSEAAIAAQRDMVVDERLWVRRADTYIHLIVWANSLNVQFSKDGESEVKPLDKELRAKVTAFASDAIRKAAKGIDHLTHKFVGVEDMWRRGEVSDEAYIAAMEPLVGAAQKFEELVRDELQKAPG